MWDFLWGADQAGRCSSCTRRTKGLMGRPPAPVPAASVLRPDSPFLASSGTLAGAPPGKGCWAQGPEITVAVDRPAGICGSGTHHGCLQPFAGIITWDEYDGLAACGLPLHPTNAVYAAEEGSAATIRPCAVLSASAALEGARLSRSSIGQSSSSASRSASRASVSASVSASASLSYSSASRDQSPSSRRAGHETLDRPGAAFGASAGCSENAGQRGLLAPSGGPRGTTGARALAALVGAQLPELLDPLPPPSPSPPQQELAARMAALPAEGRAARSAPTDVKSSATSTAAVGLQDHERGTRLSSDALEIDRENSLELVAPPPPAGLLESLLGPRTQGSRPAGSRPPSVPRLPLEELAAKRLQDGPARNKLMQSFEDLRREADAIDAAG